MYLPSVSDVAETMGCSSRDKPTQLSDLFLHYSQITEFASYVNQPVLSKGKVELAFPPTLKLTYMMIRFFFCLKIEQKMFFLGSLKLLEKKCTTHF